MKSDTIENLIREALGRRLDHPFMMEDISKCLDEETLHALYEGTLSKSGRETTIRHLDECDQCCIDLAFYFELMNAETEKCKPLRQDSEIKKGKTGRINGKPLIIAFAVVQVAARAAGWAAAHPAVAAAVVAVSVSVGTMIYEVTANPESPQDQESIAGNDSPSDKIGPQVDVEAPVRGKVTDYPIAFELPLGNRVGLDVFARDNTQFNTWEGSLGTDICAYDNSAAICYDGFADCDLMHWVSKVAFPDVKMVDELDFPDCSLIDIDENCFNYSLGEICDAEDLFPGLVAYGGTIDNSFYVDYNQTNTHDDMSTGPIPAPSPIILTAIGLGTLGLKRRWFR